MSSDQFFRAPSEWAASVVKKLEQALGLTIESTYVRTQHSIRDVRISYVIGEIEPVNEYSNDGRKAHIIEIRFLIEVPTNRAAFDLEAMDASTRLERELLLQRFGAYIDVDESEIASNLPSRFDPKGGIYARTVTVRQLVRMGPIEETYLDAGGAELYGDTQTSGGAAAAS
ncbi:MAG: hypothetical protein ACRCSE_01620 [Vibrio sp.]